MVIKILQQQTQASTGVTGTFNGTAIPLDGANMVSAQLVITSISGASGCTAQLQISDDVPGDTPVNWGSYGTTTNITANGTLILVGPNNGMYPPHNWVRMQIQAPTGSFNISNTMLVKGPA